MFASINISPREKILQRAVSEVLNAAYEPDFLECSYGLRPGGSPYQALDAAGIVGKKVRLAARHCYFSSLNHHWVNFMEHRIADRTVLRPIKKWLAAGQPIIPRRSLSQIVYDPANACAN